MKAKTLLPYIIGILMIAITLLLVELYIIAAIVGLTGAAIIMLISYDDKNTTSSSPSKHTTNRDFSAKNDWNGFTDPNDLPTDGCDNNGW